MSVLFPAYMPVTKSNVLDNLRHLDDKNRHIKANILRLDRTNIVIISSPCCTFAYNHYLFPDSATDNHVITYLTRYQGWKPQLLKSIKHSHTYINFREDIADSLYQWEHWIVPHIDVSFDTAEQIIEKEFDIHGINYQWDISVCKKKDNLGYCSIYRRSGWISIPYRIEIGLRKKPFLHTVLHEIAHALDIHYYRVNNHGPTFMLFYRELLWKYMQIDFLPSMKKHALFQGQHNGKAKKSSYKE